MVLTSDVTNLNKAVLLSKGSVLTESYLRTLKMWGVRSANVAVEQESAAAVPNELREFPPELVAEAEQYVNRRFKHVSVSHPVVETVRALAVKRKAVELMKAPSHPSSHET